ncbi:hypothetical protein ACLKA7_011634 [Drosophila subpalustris]
MRQINEQQHSTTTTDSHHSLRSKASYNSKTLPDLAKMLNQFFAIDVFQQPDTFPQNVCALCYNAVEYFQQLCTVAEESNEMLMRLTISLDVNELGRPRPMTATVEDCQPDADKHSLPLVKEEPMEDETQQQREEYDSELALDKDADVDADANIEGQDLQNDEEEETSTICEATDNSSVNKRKLLACQQCGKQVYKLPYLEAHIRSVHEGHPKPFLCRDCDKAFTRYEQLRSHMRNVHPASAAAAATSMTSEELDLICEQCNRRYSTKNALGEHLKRHAQEKPHICEHCGVAKVTRTELLTHLRIHNPDWEKFKCKQCPQLFRHKSAISRHVRVVHEGQRRFQCGHCHKRFGTHASQLRHERLHIETF